MDRKQLLIAIVAVLAIAGAAFRLTRSNSGEASSTNMKPFEYLGSSAATEVAALLNQRGDVVLVVETMGGAPSPNVEAQIKGFKSGFAKVKGVQLKSVKQLARSMSEDPAMWPAQRATQLVGMGAGAKALVYLGSFPQALPPEDVATLKGSQAALVVVGTQTPAVQALVNTGVIRLAIVGRTPPPPASANPESPGQWFARVYEVIKAK
jgi:hypothetical protein